VSFKLAFSSLNYPLIHGRLMRIALIGSGESGKSTVVKQMKIIHQNGFTRDELMEYRTTVYNNLLESAQAVVLAMRRFGLDDAALVANRSNYEKILEYRVESSVGFVFSQKLATAIFRLWQDPVIARLLDHTSEFYLMDSAS
jgi:guanine nucleotide-binding protein subunit alpha